MQAKDIQQMIETGLPGCQADVTGDDGAHFEATVVAEAFAGKTMLEQQRMVYATLGNSMESDIHALSMRTFTPEQWQERGHA